MEQKNSKAFQPEPAAMQDAKPVEPPIHSEGGEILGPVQPEVTAESIARLESDCRRNEDRRQKFWHALLYGNFNPRRRSSRRTLDQNDFFFDWHEPRVLYLALAVLLLSCTDALFTLNLLNHGAAEANIVMASALEIGIDNFVSLKIILTSLSILVLVVTARRSFIRSYRVEHILQTLIATYLMVIGYELYIYGFIFDLGFPPGS